MVKKWLLNVNVDKAGVLQRLGFSNPIPKVTPLARVRTISIGTFPVREDEAIVISQMIKERKEEKAAENKAKKPLTGGKATLKKASKKPSGNIGDLSRILKDLDYTEEEPLNPEVEENEEPKNKRNIDIENIF